MAEDIKIGNKYAYFLLCPAYLLPKQLLKKIANLANKSTALHSQNPPAVTAHHAPA
jgi:hypothetical protein